MHSNAEKLQILARRLKVATLLLRGVSNQFEICQRLGMDVRQQSTISRDVKALQKEWRHSCQRVFDERQAEELAKLDHLEKEYWEAWEHSKQERQRTRTRKASGQAPSESAELTKEKRDGNPKFLDGVLRCIDRRCALQGLNAPQRVQHGRDANATPISYEHRDSGIDPAAAAAFLADLDRLGRGVPSNGHAESLDPAHPAS